MRVVEINHRNEYLADLAVRQATAHAIEKDFVAVFLGAAETATEPVPRTGLPFYTPDTTTYAFDVTRANEILDATGYARETSQEETITLERFRFYRKRTLSW